jgi:hypothetical protein
MVAQMIWDCQVVDLVVNISKRLFDSLPDELPTWILGKTLVLLVVWYHIIERMNL